jgi:mRNA interferase MazF
MIPQGKGEIWMYEDQDSGKKRPCVIVGYQNEIEFDVTIAKLTTQAPYNEYDIFLENWKEIGLIRQSTIRCSKLFTINKNSLLYKVAEIDQHQLNTILMQVIKYITN